MISVEFLKFLVAAVICSFVLRHIKPIADFALGIGLLLICLPALAIIRFSKWLDEHAPE